MAQVTVHEAKTHLSRLLARAASGEEIIIARGGRPAAKLVALPPSRRVPGQDAGRGRIAEDFDGPLPDDPGRLRTVRLLVDTHCWLWWLLDPERLGEEARERIADAATEVLFSAASGWEIAIKVALGKLELPMDPDRYVPLRLADQGMAELPVTLRHALEVYRLPPHHADPFDRILVAQARVEGLSLATADAAMLTYNVDILWADCSPRPRAKARRRSSPKRG